jgi:hypothetical protein
MYWHTGPAFLWGLTRGEAWTGWAQAATAELALRPVLSARVWTDADRTVDGGAVVFDMTRPLDHTASASR